MFLVGSSLSERCTKILEWKGSSRQLTGGSIATLTGRFVVTAEVWPISFKPVLARIPLY